MNSELKELNFNDLLILDTKVSEYDFNVYHKNGNHKIKGFCTKCEEKGLNRCRCQKYKKYKLQAISHGSTSDDFITALENNNIDTTNWKNDSILFIAEGPSNVHDWLYEKKEYNGYTKWPTNQWYWIHDKQKKYSYPDYFKGKQYGNLFNSIIFTFELKNAYFTNLVKCGLNNNGDYRPLKDYNSECINNCFNEYLLKEIKILNPRIVFCFGSYVKKYLINNYPGKRTFSLVGLPHPSRRYLSDVFFRYLYFNLILERLYNKKIYSLDEALQKYELFLKNKRKKVVYPEQDS